MPFESSRDGARRSARVVAAFPDSKVVEILTSAATVLKKAQVAAGFRKRIPEKVDGAGFWMDAGAGL
jgi:hypothetical protein